MARQACEGAGWGSEFRETLAAAYVAAGRLDEAKPVSQNASAAVAAK
jgi:hypothetical protein